MFVYENLDGIIPKPCARRQTLLVESLVLPWLTNEQLWKARSSRDKQNDSLTPRTHNVMDSLLCRKCANIKMQQRSVISFFIHKLRLTADLHMDILKTLTNQKTDHQTWATYAPSRSARTNPAMDYGTAENDQGDCHQVQALGGGLRGVAACSGGPSSTTVPSSARV